MGSHIQFHKVADRSGKASEDGTWPLKHVTLTGKAPEQHDFPEGQVMRAVAEGWASFQSGQLVFHLADGDLTYSVSSPPDDENEDGTRSGTFTATLVTKSGTSKDSKGSE